VAVDMGSNPVALAINYNVMENINKLLGPMEIIDIVIDCNVELKNELKNILKPKNGYVENYGN
jgi:hypothetical protein